MTIRLAFTGAGWAARVHARAAQASGEATLAAVVNHKAASMAAFAAEFGIPRRYRTVPELLGRRRHVIRGGRLVAAAAVAAQI